LFFDSGDASNKLILGGYMKNRMSTKMVVEAGIMIGLATALSYFKILEMPQGGSVTLGSMIPIILFSLRYGLVPGLMAGSVYGMVQFFVGPFFVHPVQFALDYPLAFGLLGVSGLFHNQFQKGSFVAPVLGGLMAIALRFAMHVSSGAVFFAEYAPEGMNPWIYSAVYNGSYLGVELVLTVVVLILLVKPLSKIAKVA